MGMGGGGGGGKTERQHAPGSWVVMVANFVISNNTYWPSATYLRLEVNLIYISIHMIASPKCC